MPDFSFIHAADLHLGSPFQSLIVKNSAIAARFAQATRNAFTRLVDRAIALDVDFVLIAGDVYDREWKDNSIGLFFNREVARLAQADIPVVFLNGNHDAESVVTKSVPLPSSVAQLPTASPGTIRFERLRVAIHGQGFSERNTNDNLALAYPAPVPGHFNIGMLHTSLTGRPPHDTYAPCSVADLTSRGYDYWALGHVHAFEIIAEDPHIVFPGNLQGRSIREIGEKGAVLVAVTDGRVEAVSRIILDEARWYRLSIALEDCADLGDVPERVSTALSSHASEAGDCLLAIRVELLGSCVFHHRLVAERITIADDIQAACHHVHQDAWLEKLEIRTEPPSAVASPEPGSALAFEAMIAEASDDPRFHDDVDAIVRTIASRLPGGIVPHDRPFGAIDDLIEEARALLAIRSQTQK